MLNASPPEPLFNFNQTWQKHPWVKEIHVFTNEDKSSLNNYMVLMCLFG